MRFKLSKSSIWLFLILLASLFLRLWRLDFPQEQYFDENYHVPAARLIASGDPRAYEWWHQPIFNGSYHDWLHPPGAKLIQAASVKVLGNQPLAWRLPSALAGTGLIAAVYFLSQNVFRQLYSAKKTDKLSLLAAFLTAVSGLVLVQSRMATNDIFLSLWLILGLAFLFRWKPSLLRFEMRGASSSSSASLWNLILAGLFLGFGLASKWTALFLIIFLFFKLSWMIIEAKNWKLLPITFFSLLVLPLTIYISSYTQMFLQGKDLSYFVRLHQQISWYQFNRSEGHEYASTPAEWFINLRPVKYWSGEARGSELNLWHTLQPESELTANIYALGNPLLHILGHLALFYILGLIIQDRLNSNQTKIYLSLLMLYGVVWLPWLASPRVMFYYHYLPAIPILSLIMSEFLASYIKPLTLAGFWLLLVLVLVSFAAFYPHWTGFAVSKQWAEAVYFGLQSWQ